MRNGKTNSANWTTSALPTELRGQVGSSMWYFGALGYSIPKVVGFIPTVARHVFQVCPVWIYTQSNITSINNYEVNEYLLPYIFFTLNPIDTYSVSVFASNRRRQ
jgi:hypothetical protein